MQNKFLRMLGWFGVVFFTAFGSLWLVAERSKGMFIVVIMYTAAYLTWKYVAKKPCTDSESSHMSEKAKKTIKYVSVAVAAILVLLIAKVLLNGADKTNEKNELLKNGVQSMKSGMTLPFKADEYTTITDITAEQGAIRYHYTLSGINTEKLTDSILKEKMRPMVCQNLDMKEILGAGVNLEYSYSVEGTMQKYFLTITAADCK